MSKIKSEKPAQTVMLERRTGDSYTESRDIRLNEVAMRAVDAFENGTRTDRAAIRTLCEAVVNNTSAAERIIGNPASKAATASYNGKSILQYAQENLLRLQSQDDRF